MNKEEAADLLGIEITATKEQAKAAFRALAHKHHPDKNGGEDRMFKLLSEAYRKFTNENPVSALVPIGRSNTHVPKHGEYDTSDLRRVTMTVSDYAGDLREIEASASSKPDYVRDVAEIIGLAVGSLAAYQTIPTWPNAGPVLMSASLLLLGWRSITTLIKLGKPRGVSVADLVRRRVPEDSKGQKETSTR